MNRKRRSWDKILSRIAMTIVMTAVPCLSQAPRQSIVLNSPPDQKTAVSFFYFGDEDSHFRSPMNFYTVDVGDPKLHTVALGHGLHSRGWDTWITVADMRTLTDQLKQSDLDWIESRKIESFKGWLDRPAGNWLDITVVNSNGTAKARVRLTRMCDELHKLDSAMATPLILWQFQTLRWDDGCIVPGYHNEARPEQ